MENISLYDKINMLSEKQKKEVNKFVDSFQIKRKKGLKSNPRIFGSLKGKIKIAKDFDAPLEDFKDYM